MKELFFNGAKRSTNNTTLLSQFNVLKNAHTNLSTEALVAWKNRSQHLNQRNHYVDVSMSKKQKHESKVRERLEDDGVDYEEELKKART